MALGGAVEEQCKNEENHPLPSTAMKGCASVPFKWEEVPGKPKKTFMNDPLVSSHSSAYVAAIPFKWEEKPGKAKPYNSEPNPTPSVTTLSQKSPNSVFPYGSRKTSPKSLSERLEGTSQVRLSRPRKLPIAKISLPIQGTYSGQEDEDALNTWGEKELFDEVYGMEAESITEYYSSKGWEWRSSSAGCRTEVSDAAPVLFQNHVQTRMEKYKVVPVENLCKKKVTCPSLVFVDSSKKRDSWDNMVENIKKHHVNGDHEGLTFHFMQPDVAGVPSPDLDIKHHQLKIYDSLPPSGSYEETIPQVSVGKYGGYSKRTRFPPKGQFLCMCNVLHSRIEE